MNEYEKRYQEEKAADLAAMKADQEIARVRTEFMERTGKYRYGYYSSWMGRPIIQLPQDMVALQEIVMEAKPDLIIETGIAHGGSMAYSASLLELLSIYDRAEGKTVTREVAGIDIELRSHNREALEAHPLFHRMVLLEGSSVDDKIIGQVTELAKKHEKVLVLLDSNHTHAHVLAELRAYAGLVNPGSYVVVFDTAVEFTQADYSDRPWGPGNNPYTAVQEFLASDGRFEADRTIEDKIVLTSCPGGWLKRVR